MIWGRRVQQQWTCQVFVLFSFFLFWSALWLSLSKRCSRLTKRMVSATRSTGMDNSRNDSWCKECWHPYLCERQTELCSCIIWRWIISETNWPASPGYLLVKIALITCSALLFWLPDLRSESCHVANVAVLLLITLQLPYIFSKCFFPAFLFIKSPYCNNVCTRGRYACIYLYIWVMYFYSLFAVLSLFYVHWEQW